MSVNYLGLALVLNCGSSSVKYQVVDTTVDEPLAGGLIERVSDHGAAIGDIIARLRAPDSGVNLDAITVVGHRVVREALSFPHPPSSQTRSNTRLRCSPRSRRCTIPPTSPVSPPHGRRSRRFHT